MPTSHGPDRCRGNLNCRQFHDDALPAEMTSLYQCCCCDPCRYLRPNTTLNTDKHVPVNYCCRCVPRGLLLVFIPDDEENLCCREYMYVMLYTRLDADNQFLAMYTGSMFGVTVTATLGRNDSDECVWTILIERYGEADVTETYTVDHSEITCLESPTALEVSVVGPNNCPGTLILRDMEKAKLPFQATYPEGPPDPKFIDLSYNPCGTCEQVCSMLCVSGSRHGGQAESVDFAWFDNGDTRGWIYDPGGDAYLETIFLQEDEYGNCQLVFDLEDGAPENEHFEAITLGENCSCKMEEVACATIDGDTVCLTIRCGICSCWKFHCGTCRCVPRVLCVTLVQGLSASRHALTWDGVDTWGTGDLQIHLRDDGEGGCAITASLYGYDTSELSAPVQCSRESITNMFDPSAEVITFSLEDSVQELIIFGSSLLGNCARGTCNEATPCNDECGGHPDSLTITIRQWAEDGDTSGYPVDCSVSVTVHFWETADYADNDGVIKYSCGYVGWLHLDSPCCVVKVELRAGQIFLTTPLDLQTGCGITTAVVELTSEECNPYMASSDELLGVNLINEQCIGCLDQSYRSQVTVTE